MLKKERTETKLQTVGNLDYKTSIKHSTQKKMKEKNVFLSTAVSQISVLKQ